MQKKFDLTVQEIAEVLQFEHWLRFYFITEKNDELILDIPDQALLKIKEDYTKLYPLAERLNQEPMSPEKSQQYVVEYINEHIEANKKDHSLVPKVLESKKLNAEIHVFNLWVEANEEQLDKTFMEFAKWRDAYNEWKRSDKAKELITSLITTTEQAPSDTTQ